MQQNQNSLDLNQQTRIPTKGKETIKIRFSIFFDGTLNNKTNLEQRLLASPDNKLTNEERKAAAELTQKTSTKDIKKASELYKRYGAKKKGKDNSYEGYYTNVAIMEKYVESAKNSIYKLNLQTYIEGVGSLDKAKDQRAGFAFAIWHSGLIAKVKSGLSNVVTLIRENHTDKSIIIDEITLDIFGFSRGAAAARSFIFEALHGEMAIDKQLKEDGYQLQPRSVKSCFVGLYDTVSSYGIFKTWLDIGESNTRTLKLDSIAYAKQVIQLAAADEHREYFSLDDANKEITDLISSGRYRKDELFFEHTLGYEGDEGDDSSIIQVEKKNLSNKYSRIPLNLMVGYARKQNVKLLSQLEDDESIPEELSQVKQRIDQYIATTNNSEAKHWHHNNEAWLRELRHDYLHFSARYTLGHTPRYYEGKRARLTIQG